MKKDKETLYPLFKAQKTMFIGKYFSFQSKEEFFEGNIIMTGAYVAENFDPEAMEKAYNYLVKKNDTLRLQFVRTIGGIRQKVNEYRYEELPRIECENREDFQQKFYKGYPHMDIMDDKMCYGIIGQCKDGKSGGLMVYTHHINSDGYSSELMIDALEEYYDCYVNNLEPKDGPEYSFVEYIKDEQKYLKGPQYKKDHKYWLEKYTKQPNYSFPAGRTPFSNTLKAIEYTFSDELYENFMKYCTDTKITVPAMLMTIASLVTLCASGKENFCLYNLFHGRLSMKARKTIGDMYNTFAIFYNISRDDMLMEYVKKRYKLYVEALLHGRFPASSAIMMSAPETYIKRFGYNHIWFLLSYYNVSSQTEGRHIEFMSPPERFIVGVFYCAVFHDITAGKMSILLNYQSKKISDETAANILKMFEKIMIICMNNPDMTIGELEDMLREDAKGITLKTRKDRKIQK